VSLVLDASAALSRIFERSDPAEAEHSKLVLAGLNERGAIVPPLWHAEVVNALVVANRCGVVRISKAADFLTRLDHLPIGTDDAPVSGRKSPVFALAREHALSAYDATYLDLALRTGAALVTFDRKLALARDAAGVPAF
jgi:predicted nucleic acid-binding protein